MDLIKVVENEFAVESNLPKFGAGDTITVSYKIKGLSTITFVSVIDDNAINEHLVTG